MFSPTISLKTQEKLLNIQVTSYCNLILLFQDEFLVVPKEPRNAHSRYNTAWRLSFQEQEKEVIIGKNGFKDTIRLLKVILIFCFIFFLLIFIII